MKDKSQIYKYKCQTCGNIQYSNKPPRLIHICNNCGKVDIKLEAINISNISLKQICLFVSEELIHRQYTERNKGSSLYEWTTKDGNILNLREMTDEHLKNIIKYIKSKQEKE